MAFDLSTPEAQLAFQIYVSAQKTQDAKARLKRQARNSVTAQLAPYGQSVDNFGSEFSSIYNPAAKRQQAEAQATQKYVTGLPELLARVQKEKTANSRSGSGSTGMPKTNPLDYTAIYKWLLGTGVTENPETPRPVRDALPRPTRPIITTPRPGTVTIRPVRDAVPRLPRPPVTTPRPGTITFNPPFRRTINADRYG